MSATLVLKVAAPIFAFAVSGLIWAVAGPLPAGLSLVTFLLGVVTSELDHMRWKAVEAPEAAESDSAFLALLEAGEGSAAAAPIEPPPRPRHVYRCTREGLAIGSGSRRLGLVQRSQQELGKVEEPPAAPGPAPLFEIGLTLDEELFAPAPAPTPQPAEGSRPEPAPLEPALAGPARRADPPPPTVTVFRASYGARVGRR